MSAFVCEVLRAALPEFIGSLAAALVLALGALAARKTRSRLEDEEGGPPQRSP